MEKNNSSLISFMANKVKSEGGINLAQGIPAFAPPTELINLLKEVAELPIHQYAPGTGNPLLLDEISKHYNINKTNFLIVNGATEAISLIFTYLKNILPNNFSALAFNPTYESYQNLPQIFNVPFSTVDISNSDIDFTVIEQAIVEKNAKVMFLASPGNPYGRIWSKSELNKLIILAERHNAYLIFDAVYSDLYFTKEAPYTPTDKVSENVFYVNSFSKKLSITGWRIGYLMAHEFHMSKITNIHDYTGLCAPSVLQEAVALYLNKYNFGESYCTDLRKQLIANYKKFSEALNKLGFTVYEAQGGYFIWAKLPQQFTDGFDFAIELYEQTKIAIVPGIHFTNQGKQLVRFNIARHAYEISMSIDKLKKFIEQ